MDNMVTILDKVIGELKNNRRCISDSAMLYVEIVDRLRQFIPDIGVMDDTHFILLAPAGLYELRICISVDDEAGICMLAFRRSPADVYLLRVFRMEEYAGILTDEYCTALQTAIDELRRDIPIDTVMHNLDMKTVLESL